MKILSADQIRKADQYTIKNEPISSVDLMERAVTNAKLAMPIFYINQKILIVCGPGNNGGDGLVIARHYSDQDEVEVVVLNFNDQYSDDFKTNLERLRECNVKITTIKSADELKINDPDFIIDAIFGSGLNRPVEGFPAEVIEKLNNYEAKRLAIDIPSGLFADDNDENDGTIFKADETITFQLPKLSFQFAEYAEFVGQVTVLDIGLLKSFIEDEKTDHEVLTERGARKILRNRKGFSHKGTYGHALITAGGKGKVGAAVLSSKAALKSGAGLVTAHIPRCGYDVMQTAIPEVMCIVDSGDECLKDDIDYSNFNAVGVGPGIGHHEETRFVVEELIKTTEKPLVLDADALNLLSEHPQWLDHLPKGSILTPHPGEFKRLFGEINKPIKRLEKIKDWCSKTECYLLYKDHISFLVTPDRKVFFNSTGNSGMATGGSGDVLTGIITGLLAQKYSSFQAALLGMFVHGKAGDDALEKESFESLTASDIINNLGEAFKSIRHE